MLYHWNSLEKTWALGEHHWEPCENTMKAQWEQENSPKYLKTTCLPHPKESKGGAS
jgi:hypothetical protein